MKGKLTLVERLKKGHQPAWDVNKWGFFLAAIGFIVLALIWLAGELVRLVS